MVLQVGSLAFAVIALSWQPRTVCAWGVLLFLSPTQFRVLSFVWLTMPVCQLSLALSAVVYGVGEVGLGIGTSSWTL